MPHAPGQSQSQGAKKERRTPILILSRVCAEFRDCAGQTVFTITPDKLLSFLEAPEAIREDPLFDMMLRDGSLEAVQSVSQQRNLEADPKADTTAEGKKPAKSRGKAAAAEADPTAESAQPAAVSAPEPSGKKSESAGKKTEAAEITADSAETAAKSTK